MERKIVDVELSLHSHFDKSNPRTIFGDIEGAIALKLLVPNGEVNLQ